MFLLRLMHYVFYYLIVSTVLSERFINNAQSLFIKKTQLSLFTLILFCIIKCIQMGADNIKNLQHKAHFVIQLNTDSLFPFAY